MKKKRKKYSITREDILRADRKGRREAELENGNRFRPSVHKSKKSYSRKHKHKPPKNEQ